MGDLNCRIGRKCDFIENNYDLHLDFYYTSQGEIPTRNSMDRTSNRFGEHLLDLCKAVNIQCLNGRSEKDKDGRYTCMTHAGESVVDYLFTYYGNFSDITDFTVMDFNEYSNHARISFILSVNTNTEALNWDKYCTYKWNENFKNDFMNSLQTDISVLDGIIHSNQSINETVEQFSSFINLRAKPFFEYCTNRPSYKSCDSNYRAQEEWFDVECKSKRNLYLETLRVFICTKNVDNRRILHEKKRDYKFCCAKRKRQYQRQRCIDMNNLRNNRPRDFWRHFKRKSYIS